MAQRTVQIGIAGTAFVALLFGLLLAAANPARALVSWPEPQNLSSTNVSAVSPEVAVSSDGQVIAYTWVESAKAVARYSTDAGVTWTTKFLAGDTTSSSSSPRVAVSNISNTGATIAYVWTESNGAMTTAVNTYTEDSGATWKSIDLQSAGEETTNPQIALSPDGKTIALAWLQNSNKIMRALAVNGSANIANLAQVSSPNSVSEPRTVVGNAGQTIAFAWVQDAQVKQTYSITGGSEWKTQPVTTSGSASGLRAAASSSGTTIAYAWLGTAAGGKPVALSRYSFDNGATWQDRASTSNDQTAAQPHIAVSGNSKGLTLTWLQTSPGSVPIARSSYTVDSGTSFKSHTLSGRGESAQSPQSAISGDSQTIAYTWVRADGTELGVVRARVTSDGGNEWSKQDLSQTGQTATNPRSALSSDGTTLIQTWSRSNGTVDVVQSVTGSFFVLPGTPTGASAKAGSASVTVTWNKPASDGGSPITGYRVNAKILGKGWKKVGVTDTAETSFTVTGLKNNKTYKFRVAAKNIGGRGKNSEASSPVTPTATKPKKVTNLSVKWKKKKRKAVVKFKPPASGKVTKYRVRVSKPNNFKQWDKWKSKKSTKRVYYDLTRNKRYKVQVQAKNGKTIGNKKGVKFKTKQSKKFINR